MSDVIFVGGISGKKPWLDDGKSFSRNYNQGNRVYSSEGIATTLTAQPIGGTGGFTSLYLIDFNSKGERNLTKTNEVITEVSGKPFTYVSLFSGIGGFETALNKLGGTCVLASEIDRFANQSYEALYGHATAGDITKIEAEDVPDHDVLVGGFPCQAFSVAGKRGGFDDARGTLFFEVARLAKTKQPRMLLLENVKGLVSHDGGKTLDTIVQTLNDIGYHVDFNVLNSKYFGVPQNRERIFIVALRDDIAKPADWVIEGTNVVAKGKRRIAAYDGIKKFNFDWPEQTEVTTRLRDILETEVDEKYYLSDDKTAKLVAQLEERDYDEYQPLNVMTRGTETKFDGTAYCLKASRQQELLIPTGEIEVVGRLELSKNDRTNRVYGVDGVCPTPSGLGQGGGTEPKIAEEVRPVLTPDRAEKRQNGRRFKENDEESFTLTAQDKHGVAIGQQPKYRIRKLTPLECWRLQGFTDTQHQTVVDAGLSDSQRYKQAGNAVTVNVIHAIGERLITLLTKEGA
jgi:DNA (cytosine-5)-methyltransferase 1